MLSEAEIQRTLHAARVVPLDVANPHGPLGLEQLAGAVALARGEKLPERVQRPIALRVETWVKLNDLAQSAAFGPISTTNPSDLAAALLEQLVAAAK